METTEANTEGGEAEKQSLETQSVDKVRSCNIDSQEGIQSRRNIALHTFQEADATEPKTADGTENEAETEAPASMEEVRNCNISPQQPYDFQAFTTKQSSSKYRARKGLIRLVESRLACWL